MSLWKKLFSSAAEGGKQMLTGNISNPHSNVKEMGMKTFTSQTASDIKDDCMTLEIFRGEQSGQPEMGITILWDEKYEIHPPNRERTYSASEVTELLRLVVPFAVETVRANLIDRIVNPEFHEKDYRKAK